jgi:hypothetical protein
MVLTVLSNVYFTRFRHVVSRVWPFLCVCVVVMHQLDASQLLEVSELRCERCMCSLL